MVNLASFFYYVNSIFDNFIIYNEIYDFIK